MKQHKNLIDQYMEIRKADPGSVILFQKGIFYQMYYYDAVIASEKFQMKVMIRKLNGRMMPVCGMPATSLQKYEDLFVKAGYRVTVCDRTVEENGEVTWHVHHTAESEENPVSDYEMRWDEYMGSCDEWISEWLAANKAGSERVSTQEDDAVNAETSVLDEIRHLDLHDITPLKAMHKIADWKERLL